MSPTTPAPRAHPTTAARLRQHKQTILDRWLERAHQRVPAAKGQSAPALLDDLPSFLDGLATILEAPTPSDALRERENELAREHGRQRAQLRQHSLREVIDEYRLFRQVVFEVVEAEHPVPPEDRNVILDVIQAGVANAASEFTELRDRELRASNDELARIASERGSQLSHVEERFRALVEVVKDYAIFTVDPEGVVTTWNPGAQRMKGWKAEEIIGVHFSILYPEEGKRRDEPMGHLRTAAIEGRFRGEGMRIRKNGELFVADVSITPIFEDGELRGFAKVVQDLSERSVLMQERDLSRVDIERLRIEAEYRERFVATLTHDLRSPLAAARAAADLIARAPEKLDRVRTFAFRISESVNRADRMVSDLLDATRLHAGESLPLRFEPCDVEAIAREVRDELSTRYGDRFRIEIDGATTGFWSIEGLRRVLENLLTNAVKYGDPSAEITIRLERIGEREIISVHNQGSLIPPEEQSKLFTMYHRTPGAQASDKSGWGLGLTLVRGIAEAHKGMAKGESYPIEGTTFTIDIPVDVRTAKTLEEENREKAPMRT